MAPDARLSGRRAWRWNLGLFAAAVGVRVLANQGVVPVVADAVLVAVVGRGRE